MPKVTKILGNNKARAWESLGFAHKKRLCQHFDTTSSTKKRTELLFNYSNLLAVEYIQPQLIHNKFDC